MQHLGTNEHKSRPFGTDLTIGDEPAFREDALGHGVGRFGLGFHAPHAGLVLRPCDGGGDGLGGVAAALEFVQDAVPDFDGAGRREALEAQVADARPVRQFDHPDGVPRPLIRVRQASVQHFCVCAAHLFVRLGGDQAGR